MPQLARWLPFIEQFDYEIIHRPVIKHGNADGLSRRPVSMSNDTEEHPLVFSEDECDNALRAICQDGEVLLSWQGSLSELQRHDKELGAIVRLCLATDAHPHTDEVETESELAKGGRVFYNCFCQGARSKQQYDIAMQALSGATLALRKHLHRLSSAFIGTSGRIM